MKPYILFFLLFSLLLYAQNSNEQIIKEKIKQLDGLQAVSKGDEKEIISLSNDLYYISKSAGNKRGMLISLENKAVIYSNRGDTNEVLKIVSEGITLADELHSDSWKARFMHHKAQALLFSGNYTDSRINFSKAIRITNLVDDKNIAHMLKSAIYTDLIKYAEFEYSHTGKTAYKDSVLYFAEKNYEESMKISEKKFPRKKISVAQAARLLGEAFVKNSNYKEGEKYFNIAEKLLENGGDNRILAALYGDKGLLEFGKGNNEKALNYYQKALDLSKNFHYSDLTVGLYENLAQLYKKTGDTKQELFYIEKSKTLNDSLANIHKNALITQGREDVHLANKEQLSDYRNRIIFVIIGLMLLACPIFYYFYRNNGNNKKTKTNYIDQYPQKSDIDENKIALLLKMAKENDKQFLVVFQEVFADLHQELLKFDQLTSADLEMCAYLKLNIQTKEIAMYKKVSTGAVDNRKYRIRKKLNLQPESDLYKWINTIKS
ncbi:hypothetical protein CMU89_18760 [Elizabethkingia anophelis]|uniref:tetratricopeptide repeat protein n=1 Tax=Elizabethkingia anophelis TaxID=1117645 RepID=UPI000C6E448B|nr:tetratricopeptide repeat protein [Elizabethkingia anophelis]MDV3509036.1 hypothetical protein [Elizabethkingia anophelis]MDV3544669.1 hypothetical protein [Elizabethkingia anophelis]PKR31543.1 hypothetical protein CWH99_12320 [Elizabethkingia anophelis]PKR34778.1 hypothetical protein CWI00_08790 [Elizabethkingia anophelis]PRQ78247.1 hypothetical protein CMT60_19080 [Elizabethkingia anophelis]